MFKNNQTVTQIDSISTSAVRLTSYAKGLSKTDKIRGLSDFLESNQSDVIFFKKLIVREPELKTRIAKSGRKLSESVSSSKFIFQNQNILLDSLNWNEGKMILEGDTLTVKDNNEDSFTIGKDTDVAY